PCYARRLLSFVHSRLHSPSGRTHVPYTTLFRSPFVHLAAEQWRKCRRQTRRHLALVDEIAQGQTRQHEGYPHVCGKVIVRKFKCLVNGFLAHRQEIAARRDEAVVQRLSCTPKHQSRAQACYKEHGEPHRYRVRGLVIIISQPKVSVLGYENGNQEDEHE